MPQQSSKRCPSLVAGKVSGANRQFWCPKFASLEPMVWHHAIWGMPWPWPDPHDSRVDRSHLPSLARLVAICQHASASTDSWPSWPVLPPFPASSQAIFISFACHPLFSQSSSRALRLSFPSSLGPRTALGDCESFTPPHNDVLSAIPYGEKDSC